MPVPTVGTATNDQPLLAIASDAGLPDGQQEKMLRDRAFKVVSDHTQVDGTVVEAVSDEAGQRTSKIMGTLL